MFNSNRVFKNETNILLGILEIQILKSSIHDTIFKIFFFYTKKKEYEVICEESIWNLIYAIMNFNMHQSVNKIKYLLDS